MNKALVSKLLDAKTSCDTLIAKINPTADRILGGLSSLRSGSSKRLPRVSRSVLQEVSNGYGRLIGAALSGRPLEVKRDPKRWLTIDDAHTWSGWVPNGAPVYTNGATSEAILLEQSADGEFRDVSDAVTLQ